jgi:hypothetical protein
MKFSPHSKIASLKVKQKKFIMLGSFLSPLVWIVSKHPNMNIKVSSYTINGVRK